MSKYYTQLHVLKDRVKKLFTRQNMRRLIIPESTLKEFISQQDCDEFVRNKLMFNGFNMDRPIEGYKRNNDGAMLFEQEMEVKDNDS